MDNYEILKNLVVIGKFELFRSKYNDLTDVEKDEIGGDLLVGSVISRNLEIVKFLTETGVDLNSQDKNSGFTAMHFSVQEEQPEILKFLIKEGANVDSLDKHGNTPLMKSLHKRNTCPELIKVLLRNGADVNRENYHDVTPQKLASRFKVDLTTYPTD